MQRVLAARSKRIVLLELEVPKQEATIRFKDLDEFALQDDISVLLKNNLNSAELNRMPSSKMAVENHDACYAR